MASGSANALASASNPASISARSSVDCSGVVIRVFSSVGVVLLRAGWAPRLVGRPGWLGAQAPPASLPPGCRRITAAAADWQHEGRTPAISRSGERTRPLALASDRGQCNCGRLNPRSTQPVSYTHLRAHETVLDLVCRLLLEKKKTRKN